jgi:hypothetical protein
MSLENGELVDMGDVSTFDEAIVFPDVCICASKRRIFATGTEKLTERWSYAKKGERYHHIGRLGDRVFVVYTRDVVKKQGVLCLSASKGKAAGHLLGANQSVIHDIAVDDRAVVVLTSDLEAALPREILLERLLESRDDLEPSADRLALLALDPTGSEGDAPLWFDSIDVSSDDEYPEVSISADSGKLYVVRGALLEVRDALTGRTLGDWAIPGLDERVGWMVSQGAGILAEETRVSVFELPA